MGNGPGNFNDVRKYVCKCGAYFRLKYSYRNHNCAYKKREEKYRK
jgi:hypothetical protein